MMPSMRLAGLPVLVAEENGFARDYAAGALKDAGATVIGPVDTIDAAIAVVTQERVGAAIIAVRLADGPADAVAQALSVGQVPFAFLSVRHGDSAPAGFAHLPIVGHPFGGFQVVDALCAVLPRPA